MTLRTTFLEVELETVDPPDIEEWIEPGLDTLGLNFFGSGSGGVTPPLTGFFPVLGVLTLAVVVFRLLALLVKELTEAPDILLVRSLMGEFRLPPLGVRILIVEAPDVRRDRVGVGRPPGLAVRYVAVLSVVLERLDVGRDVVDIRWVLAGRDMVDFVVDGVTFKRDEATDELTDFLTVFCDRTELAEDTGLVLTLEGDLDPAREESVDREVTLAKDALVINTFLIVC